MQETGKSRRHSTGGKAMNGAMLLIFEPVGSDLVLAAGGFDGEPELLMIKRAEAEGDPWSGHIACPGGRMEPGDRDLAVTAVRFRIIPPAPLRYHLDALDKVLGIPRVHGQRLEVVLLIDRE